MTVKQYKFLKLISRRGVSASKVEKRFKNYRNDPELCDPRFQSLFYSRDNMFYISVEGKRAFENRRTENFRFRFPVFISVVALILSVVSIALQYLKF